MNFFYVINGKKLKQSLIISAAVIFAAGIVYAEKGNVSVFSPEQPSAIYNVQTEKKVIALTFDISWGRNGLSPFSKYLKIKASRMQHSFFQRLGAKRTLRS